MLVNALNGKNSTVRRTERRYRKASRHLRSIASPCHGVTAAISRIHMGLTDPTVRESAAGDALEILDHVKHFEGADRRALRRARQLLIAIDDKLGDSDGE